MSTRVLVVDDSIVFRKMLTEVLKDADGIDVVGQASNGKLALHAIREHQPDVVTLDVEMPIMDGIECLKNIREQFPAVNVIMVSSLTSKSAAMTIEALTHGAKGFVTKPREGSPDDNMKAVEEDLIPLIRSLRVRPSDKKVSDDSKAKIDRATRVINNLQSVHRSALVIGVSTGGPNALQEFLPKLPASFRVPVLIVQHMPPIFTKQLADRLDKLCSLTVVEAEDGMAVKPRTIYIAPGDYHMTVEGTIPNDIKISLNQAPRENSCRPAVDPLFRSAAKLWGKNALAVVLTGMGSDGMLGAEVLKERGAAVIAQDMESSVVWGMPGAVVSRGLADMVLPLDQIAPKILELV